MRGCDVICIEDEAGLADVLNVLQEEIMRLVRWSRSLSDLASSGANVKRLVEASIPIFENRITVVDYDLRVLAYCEADRSSEPWRVRMHERYSRVPAAVTHPYVDKLTRHSLIREPFFFVDLVGNNYCVNLFEESTYLGCCSLTDEVHEIRPFETELFQLFAAFVNQAVRMQGRRSVEQISTLRSVFAQMIARQQVSRLQVEDALELAERSLKKPLSGYRWCCTVTGGNTSEREIPEGYATKTLEELVAHTIALARDGRFVVLSLVGRDEHRERALRGKLEGFLHDMGLSAGVSRTFDDVFQTYTHLRQATVALERALEREDERPWRLFEEVVLGYMLERCNGEFEQKSLVAPELVRLAQAGPGGIGLEYIKTLRTYLDEDCNGNRAAQASYMHRSTFAQRMDRIRRFVDLSTPEQRLYLRICLHLPNVDWEKLAAR